jgi:hypothetical protein
VAALQRKRPRAATPAGPFEVVLLFEVVSGADRPARRGGDGDTGDGDASQPTLKD